MQRVWRSLRTARWLPAAGAGAATVAASTLGKPAHAQSGTTPAATPSATPAATPIASPAQTSEGTPEAPVERIGPADTIEVVRAAAPVYPGEPRRGGRLRLAQAPNRTAAFNPVAQRPSAFAVETLLEPLLAPDPATLEPRPWLARDWEWADDGRTLTVGLRDDVRWHDGSPFTATDAALSLEIYRDDPASQFTAFLATCEEVRAVDDRTLRLSLVEADGSVPFNALTLPIFQAAQFRDLWEARPAGSRTLAAEDEAGKGDFVPVGTGPWRLAARTAVAFEVERNPDYWGEPPWLDRLAIGWEAGAANRVAAWRRGQSDVLWPLRASDVADLGDRPGRLYPLDAASVMFAAFNFDQPNAAIPDLFANPDVRRALSVAIDRERYAREVFGGFVRWQAAGTVAQPWAHDAELTAPRHDPRRAGGLLEAAGWVDYNGDGILENELGVPLILKAIVDNASPPELLRVLARVKEDLLAVGVVLNIEPLGEDAILERLTLSRDFDLVAYAYDLDPGFTDYDLYGSAWDLRVNPRGWNPGAYANPDADAAIAAYLGATAIADQREALVRLQQAADDDLFGLWFGFPQRLVLVADEVLGYRPDAARPLAAAAALWRGD